MNKIKKIFTINPYGFFFGISAIGQDATHYPDPAKSPSDWNYSRSARWGDVGEYAIITLVCLALFEIIIIGGLSFFSMESIRNGVVAILLGLIALVAALLRVVVFVKLCKLVNMKKLPGHPGRFYYPGEKEGNIRGV